MNKETGASTENEGGAEMRALETLKAPEPIHLAEIIEDEMRERGWMITDLVLNMGPHFTEKDWGVCQLSWEMFFAVRTPDVILGDHMAQQLSDAFGVSPKFFTNLHEGWRAWAKQNYGPQTVEELNEASHVA